MKVLVACEESQAVCNAFRELGHEAYSCDIQPCSGGHPEWHIMGDVLTILKWLNNLSLLWQPNHSKRNRILNADPFAVCVIESHEELFRLHCFCETFFIKLTLARVHSTRPSVAHISARRMCYNQIPLGSDFMNGVILRSEQATSVHDLHPYTKKTYLWLKGLPNLKPTNIVEPVGPYVCGNSDIWKKQAARGIVYGKEKSAKHRSKTFAGWAKAMAEQWGGEAK